MRLPIFNDTFCPSEARTCGELTILVVVSLSIAFSKAPGRDVEKSLVERCASRASVKFELDVVVVVEPVVPVVPVVPVPVVPVVPSCAGLLVVVCTPPGVNTI